jgi:hypothetical protein
MWFENQDFSCNGNNFRIKVRKNVELYNFLLLS